MILVALAVSGNSPELVVDTIGVKRGEMEAIMLEVGEGVAFRAVFPRSRNSIQSVDMEDIIKKIIVNMRR
jgi:hypothetical protein